MGYYGRKLFLEDGAITTLYDFRKEVCSNIIMYRKVDLPFHPTMMFEI